MIQIYQIIITTHPKKNDCTNFQNKLKVNLVNWINSKLAE